MTSFGLVEYEEPKHDEYCECRYCEMIKHLKELRDEDE